MTLIAKKKTNCYLKYYLLQGRMRMAVLFDINTSFQTLIIWVMITVSVVAAYESLKHVGELFSKKRLRWSMFIVFVCVFYSDYFFIWTNFNSINDEVYNNFFYELFLFNGTIFDLEYISDVFIRRRHGTVAD